MFNSQALLLGARHVRWRGNLKKCKFTCWSKSFPGLPLFFLLCSALSEEAEVRRHLQQAVDAKKTAAVFGPLAATIQQIIAQCKERKQVPYKSWASIAVFVSISRCIFLQSQDINVCISTPGLTALTRKKTLTMSAKDNGEPHLFDSEFAKKQR